MNSFWELLRKNASSGEKLAQFLEKIDLVVLLPELEILKKFNQNKNHHPEGITVYDHVIAALKSSTSCEPITNLSVLFHDVGKALTAEISPNSSIEEPYYRFYNHDKYSKKPIENICSRFSVSEEEKECFIFCAENHMRFHSLTKMKGRKIKQLANHKFFNNLLVVCYCDEICRGFPDFKQKWEEKIERIGRYKNGSF